MENIELRDIFAAQVVTGLITFENGERLKKLFEDNEQSAKNTTPEAYFAHIAYRLADALMAERKKQNARPQQV